MEELEVTRLWMAGVVSMMLVFAVVALVGYLYRRRSGHTGMTQQEEGNG